MNWKIYEKKINNRNDCFIIANNNEECHLPENTVSKEEIDNWINSRIISYYYNYYEIETYMQSNIFIIKRHKNKKSVSIAFCLSQIGTPTGFEINTELQNYLEKIHKLKVFL